MDRRILFRSLLWIGGLSAMFGVHHWFNRPMRFDPLHWKGDVSDSRRLQMADDLVNRSLLLGTSREEVIGILGKPPATGYFKAWDLVYELGPERGLNGIDSEWLCVRLDGTGRVVESRILHD